MTTLPYFIQVRGHLGVCE